MSGVRAALASQLALLALSCGIAMAILCSCARSADPNAELATLEQSFAASAPSNTPAGEAGAYIKAAAVAVRQEDYAGGVIALQAAQQIPRISPDQLKAVHTAMQSITDGLVERAARGDQKAQAALAAIERTRSQ